MTTILEKQSLQTINGIGPKTAKQLNEIGIASVEDILFHLPLRYEDRTRITPIRAAKIGSRVVIVGVIEVVEVKRRPRPQLFVHVRDATGLLTLRFFHYSNYQRERLPAGQRIMCFGEMRMTRAGIEMIHPEYQTLQADETITVSDRLTPIYPTVSGLQQRTWLRLSDYALQHSENITELLPQTYLSKLQLPTLSEAIQLIHRPTPDANITALIEGKHIAQQRLALEEMIAHRLALLKVRQELQKEPAKACIKDQKAEEIFLKQLPFTLTKAQQKVQQEISADIAKPYPMLRLVQGDVGSGKTVVAALAMLQVVASGYQACLMAPTEILTEQHYKNLLQWFSEKLNLKIVLLKGSLKAQAKRDALALIASGEADIIVGTHALFQKEVEFKNLALAVIDEQHRFGVHQRLSLREKGYNLGVFPHQLIMTATPIPRTLAMSAYADLDCSVIDELPPGRKAIATVAVNNQRRTEVIDRIQQVCSEGRQVYWVCPLIEESEVLQCQAAEKSEELLQKALPNLTVALVHGRMKADEKELKMNQFKNGEINLLVATTVIEVGVDVPNATLMVIENAERLGLSQLHQLRGRVGRGAHESYCVLMYQQPLSHTAKERLTIMRQTNDGFKIAEKDLEIRGPGEVLGTKQTGSVDMRIADIMRDQALLPQVQQIAQEILKNHPEKVESLVHRWLGNKVFYVNA